MAVTTEDLVVRISADIKAATNPLEDIERSVQRLGKNADRSAKSVDRIEKELKGLGFTMVQVNQALDLAQRAMRGIAKVTSTAINPFIEYQQALVGVQKTSNLSGQELMMFGDEIQSLSERIPIAASSLLDMAQTAGQLGVEGADDLANFAETVAKVEVSTNLMGEEAATSFARILNVTGEAMDQVDEFASVVVRLGNNFAANEREIVRMSNEVARSTSVFKLSSAEVAALSTALTAVGVRAELGGSSVGRAFRAISAAIKNGGEELEALQRITGQTGDQLEQTFSKDAVRVFQDFIEGLGRIEASDVPGVLEQFNLKGEEVLKVLPVIAQRAELVGRAFQMARDEIEDTTALNEEASRAFGTLQSRLNVFMNTLTNLAADIGAELAPALTQLIELATDSIKALRELGNIKFKDMVIAIGEVTAAFIALKLALDLSAGIAAVGGLSSAIALMGGLSGQIKILSAWLTTVTAQMAIFAKGAVAALLPLAKFAVLAVAAVGVTAAIETLIRNVDRLGKVGELVGLGFQLSLSLMEEGAIRFFKMFGDGVLKITETLHEWGLVSDEQYVRALKNAGNFSDQLSGILELQGQIRDEFDKTARELDIGPVGGLFLDLKEQEKEFVKDAKDLGETVGNQLGESMMDSLGDVISESARDTLQDLEDLTVQLARDLASVGQGRVGMIQLETDEIMDQINELDILLSKEKGVNEELRKRLILTAQNVANAREAAMIDNLQKMATEEVTLATIRLSAAIQASGKDEIAAIDARLKMNQLAILQKAEQLKKDGLLTDEIKDQLNAQNLLLIAQAAEEKKLASQAKFWKDIKNNIKTFFGEGVIGSALQEFTDFVKEVSENPYALVGKAVELLEAGVGAVFSKVLTGDIFKSFGDFVGMIGNLPRELLKVFQNLSSIVTNFIQAVPQLVRTLLDQLPQIAKSFIDAIPKMVDIFVEQFPRIAQAIAPILTEMIDKLLEALPKLISSIPDILQPFIEELPRIFESLFSNLPDIILSLLDAVGDVIAAVIEKIPEIFMSLLDNLPEIIKKLVDGLIRNIVVIAVALVKAIAENILPITRALLMIGPQLAIAILEGIVDGLRRAWDSIMGGGGDFGQVLSIDTDQVMDQIRDIGAQLTGATSDLFSVSDLTDGPVQDAVDQAQEILDKIEGFARKAGQTIWEAFIEWAKARLQALFNWGKKIWDGFREGVGAAVEVLKSWGGKIWNGLKEAVMKALDFFGTLGTAIWNGFKAMAEAAVSFITGLGQLIWNGLKSAFDAGVNAIMALGAQIWDGLTEAFNIQSFKNLGSSIADGLSDALPSLWNGFKNLGTKIIDGFKEAANSVGGALSDVLGFAKGGIVPGVASFAGNNRMNDMIPAVLSPGEAVIPRSAMADPLIAALVKDILTGKVRSMAEGGMVGSMAGPSLGLGDLSGAISRVQGGEGGSQTQNNTFNIDLKIRTEQPIDEKFVRSKLMPKLKDELRRQSLDGKFILSKQGIR